MTVQNDREFAEKIRKIIDFNNAHPARMNASLDLKLTGCSCKTEQPYVEYEYTVKEQHTNPYGELHGAIITALHDTGTGIGAVALTGTPVTTTEITVSYLRPVFAKKVRERLEYTIVGNRMIRSIGKLYDAETGKLCSTAMTSFVKLSGVQVEDVFEKNDKFVFNKKKD